MPSASPKQKVGKLTEDPREDPGQEKIDGPKVNGDTEREKNDDQRGVPDLLLSGPSDLLQLGLRLPQKTDARYRIHDLFGHTLPSCGHRGGYP